MNTSRDLNSDSGSPAATPSRPPGLAQPWRRLPVAVLAVVASAAILAGGVAAVARLQPPVVHAQQPPGGAATAALPGAPAVISVVGDGIATAQPTSITLQLGVQRTAQTPAEALAQTQSATENVLQRLRSMGIPEKDLQTSGLGVYAVQGGVKGGAPADPTQITGYNGNATITVQASDVSQASSLLTAGLDAGATTVQGLSYGLKDDRDIRLQALTAAVNDAGPKASAAATAAGLTLAGIRSVEELPVTPPKGAIGLGGGGGVGIAPGELTTVVRVQVTYDITR